MIPITTPRPSGKHHTQLPKIFEGAHPWPLQWGGPEVEEAHWFAHDLINNTFQKRLENAGRRFAERLQGTDYTLYAVSSATRYKERDLLKSAVYRFEAVSRDGDLIPLGEISVEQSLTQEQRTALVEGTILSGQHGGDMVIQHGGKEVVIQPELMVVLPPPEIFGDAENRLNELARGFQTRTPVTTRGLSSTGPSQRTIPSAPPATSGAQPSRSAEPTAGEPKTAELATTAHVGEPLEPVHEPADFSSIKGAAEGLGIALVSKQVENFQLAEIQKAENQLKQLSPDIARLVSQGNIVVVRVVVEAPNRIDPFAEVSGFRNREQVTVFKGMSIALVEPAKKYDTASYLALSSQPATYRANLVPVDPEAEDPHVTLEQQIDQQLRGTKDPQPRRAFHYEYHNLTFYPETSVESGQEQGFIGTYRPYAIVEANFGKYENIVSFGMHRLLRIRQGSMSLGSLMAEMWDSDGFEQYSTDFGVGNEHAEELRGRFSKRKSPSTGEYRIVNTMRRVGGGPTLIIEHAVGEDLDPQWNMGSKWGAVIVWKKLGVSVLEGP